MSTTGMCYRMPYIWKHKQNRLQKVKFPDMLLLGEKKKKKSALIITDKQRTYLNKALDSLLYQINK